MVQEAEEMEGREERGRGRAWGRRAAHPKAEGRSKPQMPRLTKVSL